MTEKIRPQLENIANELAPHTDNAAASGVHAEVQSALVDDRIQGLGDRIEHYMIDLEVDHPTIAALLRSVIDELSAGGI